MRHGVWNLDWLSGACVVSTLSTCRCEEATSAVLHSHMWWGQCGVEPREHPQSSIQLLSPRLLRGLDKATVKVQTHTHMNDAVLRLLNDQHLLTPGPQARTLAQNNTWLLHIHAFSLHFTIIRSKRCLPNNLLKATSSEESLIKKKGNKQTNKWKKKPKKFRRHRNTWLS